MRRSTSRVSSGDTRSGRDRLSHVASRIPSGTRHKTQEPQDKTDPVEYRPGPQSPLPSHSPTQYTSDKIKSAEPEAEAEAKMCVKDLPLTSHVIHQHPPSPYSEVVHLVMWCAGSDLTSTFKRRRCPVGIAVGAGAHRSGRTWVCVHF